MPIVEKDIFDEEKVPQGSVTLEGAHDLIVEVDESAFNQPSMVHDDKQLYKVEKVDTVLLPMVQDKIAVIPHIDFVILKEFNDVMECKTSLSSVLPTVVPILTQKLHARVLIILHFKTRDQVFSNQSSMMEGALKSNSFKILFLNLKLFLNLNFEFSF